MNKKLLCAALLGALMAEMPVAPRPATNTLTSYVPCSTTQHSTAQRGTAQHKVCPKGLVAKIPVLR